MSLLSVIVPCYNEEESVALFYQELTKNDTFFKEKDIELELLYIDDGSKDGTVREVKKLIEADPRVHIISFSRNFGKEAAMYAGLSYADGDYVAIMDVDLQDPPELLPKMYEMVKSGICDSVATKRSDRTGEPVIRSFLSENFYKFINKISKTQLVYGARDYRIMCRKMVDAVLQMSEYNRFSKGIFSWVGFKTEWLEYENVNRIAGETKWSFWGLFKYAVDGIINFSETPMSLASGLGIFLTIFSFLMVIFIIIRKEIFGDPVAGWPSLACIIIFIAGLQFLCMGIMGKYIAKTYLEVKNRPHYIVSETNKDHVDPIH